MITETETPLYVITRAMLLAEGSLIDVSATAAEAGFRWPVAISIGVDALIDAIPTRLVGIASREGRLWDVIWMARCAIRGAGDNGAVLTYELLMPLEGAPRHRQQLTLVCGPGDDGAPVLTILLPDED